MGRLGDWVLLILMAAFLCNSEQDREKSLPFVKFLVEREIIHR